ncbi:ATP-binding cassette domain-containing protein [Levilactobacillus cerevisiae]|uniref:ATP-binding cassette domain-containing protein n=1 Tax=Levilactobacillus cerevisiae TaxID=1704076 RepID=UPI001CDCB95E|nr:ATP-binding cassette domain-containing protein [Levilactobacillus cerevisiae]
MELIRLTNVRKQFGRQQVLRDVSFQIEVGTIAALMGINGSGKTLILKSMLGLMKTQGEITIKGVPLKVGRAYPVSAGIMIESPSVLPEFSAVTNLELIADLLPDVTNQAILDLLREFDLPTTRSAKVRNFSLGMKQKLGIAQAVLGGSELIVLDEPTNALDAASIEKLITYLRQLRTDGSTLVIASHDEAFVTAIADQRIRVEAGTIK